MEQLNQLAWFLGLPIHGFWPPKLAVTLAVGILAARKGRNIFGWSALGVVVPLFALGAICFAPPRAAAQPDAAAT